jgi:hypothetical protein
MGVLGMQAMHVKMSKPAVPQYMVALGNTRVRVVRFLRGRA